MKKTIKKKTTPIRKSKSRAVPGDIVQLILQDHKELKVLIRVMKNAERDLMERKAALEEFAPRLLAHAKPEEQVWYPVLKDSDQLREVGFESVLEHRLAEQLVEESEGGASDDELSAKIKVLAEMVEQHIETEETKVLPKFKRLVNADERVRLGEDFLTAKHKIEVEGFDDAILERRERSEHEATF